MFWKVELIKRPPLPSLALPPPPLPSTPPRCPSRSTPPALVVCGAGWQSLFGASWMHGYSAVRGCEVDVMFVSSRQLLKYNLYEILHRKERKAKATRSLRYFRTLQLIFIISIRRLEILFSSNGYL